MQYNKLVRDRIPEIIAEHGAKPVTRTLDAESYSQELLRKLQEEVTEFGRSGSTEELADILEVVYALAAAEGVDRSGLEEMRRQKRLKRGGFDGRVFLVETQP